MPYQCGHCGGTYCADHRLPEAHDCPGLDNWNDPKGVFDSGFDDSVDSGGSSQSSRFDVDTGPGGIMGYFRGNMTYVFLAVMAVVFVTQRVVLAFFGPAAFRALFVLHPDNIFFVWTWVTSVFSHGGLFHIAGNAIVIYFFGRLAEQQMGSKTYTIFFLGSGVLAGLGQVGLQLVQGGPAYGVLGASGAALAILGFVTVLNPDLTVYLYFLIPVPIWAITGFYAIISIAGTLSPQGAGLLGGNIAHTAHLVGLVIGLWYGRRVKDRARIPGQIQFGGRRGGPGGPGGPGGRGPF